MNVRPTAHEETPPVVLRIHPNNSSTSLENTVVVASSSTQPAAVVNRSIPTPVMTLEGHEPFTGLLDGEQHTWFSVASIAYFPDGEQMISGSGDKTTRQWDLRVGEEIKEARDVCEQEVRVVAVSGDGRWIVTCTSGGDDNIRGELKARNVDTRVVNTFQGHSDQIMSIDISVDSTLLAGGSRDGTTRIWSLETGKLEAGPFESADWVGAVRFSQDSKKLAVMSMLGKCLEVWDVKTQRLDARVGKFADVLTTNAPVFWTTKDKSIVAEFSFKDEHDSRIREPKTIYEFDAWTLETVGAPFEGHTNTIIGLALSFDCVLLASTSYDNTIKLWAFESRQLLASFDVQNPHCIIFSPNSHQLAYTTWRSETKIYIYDTPPAILANIWSTQETQANTSAPNHPDLLNSDATRRAKRHNPAVSFTPRPLRPSRTIHSQRAFLRYLRKLLPSRTNAVPPVLNNQSRDPLDFPATSPLPPNYSSSAQATTHGFSHMDPHENSRTTRPPLTARSSVGAPTTFKARLHPLSTWWPVRAGHIVDVPLAQGKERNAAAGAPTNDDDLIRDEDYIPSTPPSPNPDSQQRPAGGQIDIGDHGTGRLCGCF